MSKTVKIVLSVIILFVMSVGIFFACCGFIVVVGNSMNDTYKTGDVVFYKRTQAIECNDIIVFTHDGRKVIKRVVGLGGDVISIKDNILYINGVKDENESRKGESADLDALTIPDGCAFVLGDNLTDSIDSRAYGVIEINTIKGQVI